jgi:exosortase/archaeosortase family protein
LVSLEVSEEDYERSVVAGFTVIAGALGLLTSTTYRWVFEEFVRLTLTEPYSYLIVALLSVLAVLHYTLRSAGLSYEFRLSKTVASVLLLSLGGVLYLSSRVDPTYSIQLGTASFVMVFLSLLTLVYRPTSPRDVVPLLSLLVLIPVPVELADAVTQALSRFIGAVASALTGSRLVGGPGYTGIEVVTPQGPTLLEVEAVCSGVVALAPLLTVVPVITYIAAFSPRSTLRKVISVAVSIAIALLVGTTGNLVRVVLVVVGSSRAGLDLGINPLHIPLSLVYSSISTVTSLVVACRVGGIGSTLPRVFRVGPRVRWDAASGVLVGVLALAVVYQVSTYYTLQYPGARGSGLVVEVGDLENFINDTPRYVLRGTELTSYRCDPHLAGILGALRVYEVTVATGGRVYRGYVEVASTPATLRTWQVYLATRGYSVVSSWTTTANATPIHLIELEGGGGRGVVAYTTIPIHVVMPSGTSVVYVRISLVKFLQEPGEDVVGEVTEVLHSTVYRNLPQPMEVGRLVQWALASYVLLALLLAYTGAVALHPILRGLRNLFSR